MIDGLKWETAHVYLDDVIVFGRIFEEELQRLEKVFHRFRKANLKLNRKKCVLFQQKVPFHGHVVSSEGAKINPEKVNAVRTWSELKNKNEVLNYTYYHRFVKNFSCIATPLHQFC